MVESFIESLVTSLVLTLIIELSVSVIIGIRKWQDFKVVILANIITNPFVVFTTNCILLLNNLRIYACIVIILEIFAFIVEFLIFKEFLSFKKISPLIISLLNNGISFGIGLIILLIDLLS